MKALFAIVSGLIVVDAVILLAAIVEDRKQHKKIFEVLEKMEVMEDLSKMDVTIDPV